MDFAEVQHFHSGTIGKVKLLHGEGGMLEVQTCSLMGIKHSPVVQLGDGVDL